MIVVVHVLVVDSQAALTGISKQTSVEMKKHIRSLGI